VKAPTELYMPNVHVNAPVRVSTPWEPAVQVTTATPLINTPDAGIILIAKEEIANTWNSAPTGAAAIPGAEGPNATGKKTESVAAPV